MAEDDLGYLDYLKAAFRWRWRVPVLGGLPINYLGLATFGVLGLANPGFWFVGAAGELLFLLGVSSNERFQRLVRATRKQTVKESWEQRIGRVLSRLKPESQRRYQRLLDQCRQVLGISEALDDDGLGSMRQLRSGGLNQILWIFLRLLASREILQDNMTRVDSEKLQDEITALEARLGDTDAESALGRSLSGTLEIQKRRLENLARANESLAVIDAELGRIENQVILLREESAVSGKAEILSSRLDAVSTALSETNRWMEQNAHIFGEMGADPLGSTPQDLPDLPPTPPLALEGDR